MDPSHRENLLKLAAYLEQLPPDYVKFDMSYLIMPMRTFDEPHINAMTDASRAVEVLHQCGTVACALGHGPEAGITPKPGSSWTMYATDSFGIGPSAPYEWDWLFSENWAELDNTPQGAAKRIRHFIEHGVPEEFKALNRDDGDDPMAYDPAFYS